MKTLTLLLSLGLILGGAKPHAQRVGGEPLNLAPAQAASLKLRTAGFRYVGTEASAGDVCVHEDPVMLDGRSYNWSDAQMDGLFAENSSRGVSKVYQPYDLASRAGWYKGEGEPEPNNNIWGLFVSGGKVWMGTNGLGVLAFDPVREEWTRYDWQTEAAPGTRTYLVYLDGKHMFVNRLGGLFVYSVEKDVSVRLPFPGYGSGEARLVNGETYVIEFAAQGFGGKSYAVGVSQLDGYFSTLAP